MSTRLCAYPIRTVMFRPNCLYCGASASYYKDCDFQLSTIACKNEEHQHRAKRDAFAWLHRKKSVRRKEYEKEPLFCETTLLTGLINVRRASGKVESDWKILEPIDFLQKHIPLESLKMSIPDEQHGLVDDLVVKLEAGFYTEFAAAYDAAAVEQASMDAAVAPKPPPIDYIETRFHAEHGEVRVFNPPI